MEWKKFNICNAAMLIDDDTYLVIWIDYDKCHHGPIRAYWVSEDECFFPCESGHCSFPIQIDYFLEIPKFPNKAI